LAVNQPVGVAGSQGAGAPACGLLVFALNPEGPVMLRYVVTYITTLLIFGAIDLVWLGVVATNVYRRTLGDILLDQFRPGPALAFYLLNIVGLMVFAVPAAGGPGAWRHALLFGALFGFFSYGTYDLTNFATLRVWTLNLTIIDMAWGTVLSATATALGVAAAGWILGLLK
jgi:uncharacterized membrane protein